MKKRLAMKIFKDCDRANDVYVDKSFLDSSYVPKYRYNLFQFNRATIRRAKYFRHHKPFYIKITKEQMLDILEKIDYDVMVEDYKPPIMGPELEKLFNKEIVKLAKELYDDEQHYNSTGTTSI